MENTTNMNTPEIKVNLMNEVQGSVVSNEMLDTVHDLTEATRRIGQLEGELRVTNNELHNSGMETERLIEEAKKTATIILKDGHALAKNRPGIRINMYDDLISAIETSPDTIQSIKVGDIDLSTLANAAVKGDAKSKIDATKEEAAKEVKEAKDKMDLMEKTCKRNEKKASEEVETLRKTQKETLLNAVKIATEREEKQNRKDIAAYKLQIDALNKENDLQLEEKENLARERDLALEAQGKHIRLLENRLDILNQSTSNIFKAIKARMSDWYFKNKINRLDV